MTAETQRSIAEEAAADAERAADAAGVHITELSGPAETRAAAEVLHRIWPNETGMPMPPELLRTFSHTSNYVAGVFLDGRLVGVAAGFHTGGQPALHSHIAGVLPAAQGRSAGLALKLHQRAWALHRGIGRISWTFDPLIRRNAHFNLNKLGASVLEYLPDFYGSMTDAVNAGEESDRLLVDWDLTASSSARWAAEAPSAVPVLAIGADGGPVVVQESHFPVRSGQQSGFPVPTEPRLLVAVPEDVEALRVARPDLSGSWRLALRDVLQSALAAGYRIAGVARSGHYVLERNQ